MYGESIRSGTVLVVKTHYRSAEWTKSDQPQLKPVQNNIHDKITFVNEIKYCLLILSTSS